MAIAVVDICNMALGHVGSGTIQDILEKSPEAIESRRWYEICVKQSQEAHDWSFCRRRQALALSSEDPTSDWAYRYQYPDQCLKFRRIYNPAGKDAPTVPYEVLMNAGGNARTILTNAQSAEGIFTFYQEATDLFTPYYVDTLSHLLASRMAFKLTGKRSLVQQETQMYGGMIRQAAAFDSNEQVDNAPKDADWIQHREGIDNYGINASTFPYWAI